MKLNHNIIQNRNLHNIQQYRACKWTPDLTPFSQIDLTGFQSQLPPNIGWNIHCYFTIQSFLTRDTRYAS